MSFSAADVKKLREMTGVGMMKCKEALTASDGDMDKAVDYLREKGAATAVKKASKVAAEGMSYATVIDGVGVVVEVNSNTDFVAKNERFQGYVKDVASVIAKDNPADLDALMACKYPGTDRTVKDIQNDNVLAIGENINVRRFARYEGGVNIPYIHMGGKIGVLVNLEVEGIEPEKVTELGKDVAMQVAAMAPSYVSEDEVPADEVEKEKSVQLAKAMEEGKENTKIPAAKAQMIAENKVKGRMKNFFAEICLLDQAFVKENKITVGDHVKHVAKELGGKITVVKFTRYATGEGIDKPQEDFAAEVASMAKKQ